jgi:hypothetical protein
MLAKATKAEDAYLLLQVLDCRDYRTAGMGDRGQGILELPEVFVPLELDSSSIPAGFEQSRRMGKGFTRAHQNQKYLKTL